MAIAVRAVGSAVGGSGGSITVPVPAGTQAGDLLVTFLHLRTTAHNVLSGWTLIVGSPDLANARGYVYYKIATGSEPANYTWSGIAATGAQPRAITVAFSGVDNSDVLAGGTSQNPSNTTAAITTDAANAWVIGASYVAGNETHSNWSVGGNAMTEIFDVPDGSTKGTAAARYEKATAGSTGALTVTKSGANVSASQLFALKPAATAATHQGSVTATGTGALTSAAVVTKVAAATATGTGALASTAVLTNEAVAALSGTGSLSAAGEVIEAVEEHEGAATLTGVGDLAATATITTDTTASLTGVGDASADATVIKDAAATLPGTSGLTSDAIRVVEAAASLQGNGALDAGAFVETEASATLTGTGSLEADATVTEPVVIQASATLTGVGRLNASYTDPPSMRRGGFNVIEFKPKRQVQRSYTVARVGVSAVGTPLAAKGSHNSELAITAKGQPIRVAGTTATTVAVSANTTTQRFDSEADIATLLTLMELL